MPSLLRTILLVLVSATTLIRSQSFTSSDSGYAGYSLGLTGDRDSAVFETDETDTAATSATVPPPDVFLNASLSVGEIQIIVENLTAKVNIDAQVLSLLTFNAGVDVSIGKVNLTIENITAKVLLEARLGNLAAMISDVLDSIDLNPLIASLGSDLTTIASGVGTALNDTTSILATRGMQFEIDSNILYSINDYSGNTHTNRILEHDGSIVDQFLDNDGNVHAQKTIGNYTNTMTFTGHNISTVVGGQNVQLLEYRYTPYHGFNVISAIYIDAANKVVKTRVLSETSAGGTSTIGNNS